MCQLNNRKKGIKIAFALLFSAALLGHAGMGVSFANPSEETLAAEKAVLQNPTNDVVLVYVKALLKDYKKAYKQKNYEEALDYIRAALYFLNNSPNSKEYIQSKAEYDELISKTGMGTSQADRFEVAKALYMQGKNFAAAYEFSNLLKEKYEVDLCYEFLGDIASKMGYKDYAILSYKKSFNANPNNFSAKYKYSLLTLNKGSEDDAIYYLEEVIENTSSSDLIQEIITHFQRRAEQNPDNENNYDVLGLAYQKLGQYDKTYNYLKKSLVINPKDVFIRYHLGNLLFNIKEYPFALEVYSEVLEDNPYESQIRISRAKAYNAVGKQDLAISDYQIVLAMYPDSMQAQWGMYELLKNKLPLDKIVSMYYPIDSNIKFGAKGYNSLGYFANKLQKPKDAVVFFEKSLSLNPKSDIVYIELYKLYQLLDQKEKANDIIQKGYKLFPNNSEINKMYSAFNSEKTDEKYNVALSYIRENDWEKAIAVYQQIEPKTFDIYFQIANAYRQLGDLNSAISNYKKALELKSDDSEVYYALGVAYIELEDLKSAKTAFEKSVNFDSKNEKAKKMLSFVQQKEVISNIDAAYEMYDKKDYRAALRQLDKAVEKYRQDPQIFYYRGLTKDELGDYAGAVADYKMVISLDRNFDPSVYFKLAEDLERINKPREALINYEKFLGADNIDTDMARHAQRRQLDLSERYY